MNRRSFFSTLIGCFAVLPMLSWLMPKPEEVDLWETYLPKPITLPTPVEALVPDGDRLLIFGTGRSIYAYRSGNLEQLAGE